MIVGRSVEPLVISILSFERSESVRVTSVLASHSLTGISSLDLLKVLPASLLGFSVIGLLGHVKPDRLLLL
jgi:hypothetical protein